MKDKIIELILDSFQKPETHPTAEELFERLTQRLKKVNKEEFRADLKRLVKEHRIYYVLSTDKKKHYGLSKGYHGHYLCASCGKVRDFIIGKDVEKMLTAYLKEITHSYGVLDRFNLSAEGLCHECLKSSSTP